MNLSKENIKKRLRNWKTWVAVFSLLGFILTKFGMPGAKNFLDELAPYVFVFGMSLGILIDHETSSASNNEKGDVK
ncbi:hypothetical protein [Bacillus albus]|uniref:hypothetical protein n=1 Tax=Bacillus cereus group TaxID=86661 RepID=UPI002570F365|nr:hypothetical protein [Bacillus albus]WJE73219.1 hypothetical protein QRY64_15235 [Bacillus albus]